MKELSQAFPQDLLKDFILGHHSIWFHIVVMVPEVSLWESKLHLLYQRSVNSAALITGWDEWQSPATGQCENLDRREISFYFSHTVAWSVCFCGFMFEYVLYLTLKTHSIQTNSTQAFLNWSHVWYLCRCHDIWLLVHAHRWPPCLEVNQSAFSWISIPHSAQKSLVLCSSAFQTCATCVKTVWHQILCYCTPCKSDVVKLGSLTSGVLLNTLLN